MKPRILFIDDKQGLGGGQVILSQLMNSAASNGMTLCLMAPVPRQWEHLLGGVEYSAGNYWEQYEFIYINGIRRFWQWAFILHNQQKAICFIHQHIEQPNWRIWGLRFFTTGKPVVWVAISRFIQDRLIARGVGMRGIFLLKNSLRPGFPIVTARRPLKKSLVYLGRIIKEKGVELLIDFSIQNPDWHIHIIGDSSFGEESYARNLRARSGENVVFHGHQSNVSGYILKLDVSFGIVPSIWEEPFGLTALELVACGLITLVRPVGGLIEIAAKLGLDIFNNADDLNLSLKSLMNQDQRIIFLKLNIQQNLLARYYSYERYRVDFYKMISGFKQTEVVI